MGKKVRVFISDDHQMFIDGIQALLEGVNGIIISGSATTGRDTLEKLGLSNTDIVLMDIGMPEMNGIETTSAISKKFPEINVIALTMYDDINNIKKMITAGAKGYVLKNTSKQELVKAIENVSSGKTYYSEKVVLNTMNSVKKEGDGSLSKLTEREIEIIKLIIKSFTNKEISEHLNISELTVNTHRKNAMRKLSLKNTAGLVKFGIEHGL